MPIMKKLQLLLFFSLLYVAGHAQMIATIAGKGLPTFGGDGGISRAADLNYTCGIAIDKAGNLFVADAHNQRIRKIDAITGIISTVAGNGISSFSGDGGPAISAKLSNPTSVAVDDTGNLYIADCYNNRIRKVSANTGIITTIAGNGSAGFSGDGGTATAAKLSNPSGIAVDRLGNLYIADPQNQRIRKVSARTGFISTIAGNGTQGFAGDGGLATAANLKYPLSVTLDSLSNIYIADQYNNRIRKVDALTGIITTVAGNGIQGFGGDGAAANSAQLNLPSSVSIDPLGNLYIADQYNNRIRKVNNSTGIIQSIVGKGAAGFGGDGGIAGSASLNHPTDIAIDGEGNLYISDRDNNRIRKVWYTIVNSISSNQIVCSGSAIDSIRGNSPLGASVNCLYRWLESTKSDSAGFVEIPNENSPYYKPSNLTQNTWYRRSAFFETYQDTSEAILITVNPKPMAGFTINNPIQCYKGNSFTFTDTTSSSVYRVWTMSDRSTNSDVEFTKSYFLPGTYNISIEVTDNNNCSDTLSKIFVVKPSPLAGYIVSNPVQCLKGNAFNFTDTTSNIQSRIWSMGDLTTQTDKIINKSYLQAENYNVKLKVINVQNCSDSIVKLIKVNPSPNAGFTVNNSSQCLIGNSFSFEDTTSSAASRVWSLGDMTGNTSLSFSKSYAQAGSYLVTLKLINSNLCIDSASKSIVVKANPAQPIITAVSSTELQSSLATSYQWYKDGNKINGATNQLLNIITNGTYIVKIDCTNSCDNTSNPFVASSVGLNEMALESSLRIYPNPCKTELHIEVEGLDKLSLQMFAITGKAVTEPIEFIHSTQINTQDLNEGIYFLKFTDENGTFIKTEKVMVLR